MIKLSRHFYIHWLTLALFATAYITRTLSQAASVYAVMLLHELAHTAAALRLGLGVSHIILYPFGVTLKVGTRMVCSLADEVILYLSGPLVNVVAALLCGVFVGKNSFYYNNILLFVLNMLPVLPLDGGQLALGILSAKIGANHALRILKAGAVVLAAAIVTIILCYGKLGINSIAFCGFILACVFTQREKYNRDFIREMSCRKKRRDLCRGEIFFAGQNTPLRKIAEQFNPSKDALVVVVEGVGEIRELKTKDEIINDILYTTKEGA